MARPGWPNDDVFASSVSQGIPYWQGGSTSWNTTVTVKGGCGYLPVPLGFGGTVTGVTVNLSAGATFSAPVWVGRSGPGAGAPNGFLLFQPPAAGCPDGIYDLTITSD